MAALHKERFSNRLPTKVEINNADQLRHIIASQVTEGQPVDLVPALVRLIASGEATELLETEDEEAEEDGKPLSDSLIRDLTAHRTLALRLALAARELQDVDTHGFITLVSERLGLPLTAEKLNSITVADVTLWFKGEDGAAPATDKEDIKRAVRFLWGQGINEGLPAAEPYAEGDMPNSLRIAVASTQGTTVDGHFGSAPRFLIYQVSATDYRLVDVRSTLETDGAEDKNVARAALINDCQLVYVQSIGGPAAAKVVRANVHPVKWPAAGPVDALIGKLQSAMLSPPPWLARIMGVEPASLARFAAELEESES